MFGSVGDDKHLILWDTRAVPASAAVLDIEAHDAEVNCLSFNPYNETLLATGSADKTVNLFDIRNTKKPLHTFRAPHRGGFPNRLVAEERGLCSRRAAPTDA